MTRGTDQAQLGRSLLRRATRFVVRLSVLLVLLQLLGLPQLVSHWRDESDGGCSERCADFDAGEEAPCGPLCPTCTCTHARSPALPGACVEVIELLASSVVPVVLPRADQLPVSPDLESIFRPPRA